MLQEGGLDITRKKLYYHIGMEEIEAEYLVSLQSGLLRRCPLLSGSFGGSVRKIHVQDWDSM